MAAYSLHITSEERAAILFALGRYAWPEVLDGSVREHDDGHLTIELTEPEAWAWLEDIELDTEGGHAPFPLASPDFAAKLQRLADEVI